jgi:NAD-dependent dihydropyrimidine dehydrogenase PreA subunit
VKRKVIEIDQERCTGCGQCIPGCPEGALQIIDGKARLISDLFCDGLGACVGACPEGALLVVEREAEAYDEKRVMVSIVRQGENTLRAHLQHLKDHGAHDLLAQAREYLREQGMPEPADWDQSAAKPCGCPGAAAHTFQRQTPHADSPPAAAAQSELGQWPVQLRLLRPGAPFLDGSHLLVCADCVPFSLADFHARLLRGRTLAVFCPKLDTDRQEYVDKLATMLREHSITGVTVARMEVPCCGGTEQIVRAALQAAQVDLPVDVVIVSLDGHLLTG